MAKKIFFGQNFQKNFGLKISFDKTFLIWTQKYFGVKIFEKRLA